MNFDGLDDESMKDPPVVLYLGTKKTIVAYISTITGTLLIVQNPFEVHFKNDNGNVKSLAICPFLFPIGSKTVTIMTAQIVSMHIAPPFLAAIYTSALESMEEDNTVETTPENPKAETKPKIDRRLH